MCNHESIGMCREVCEQSLWRKERERERERQAQFTTTFYSNLCWLFWRSNDETLSDWAAIFIKDFSLVFLQSERWDCLLEVCRSVKKFVKSYCPQEVPITVSLSCFGNPTLKSSPIALKFLLEFYHSKLVILDGCIWDRSSSLFPENLWTLAIFSSDEILELFLINFNLLIFLVIVGDHLRIRKSCIDMLCDWFFMRLIVLLFWY